MGWTHLRKTRGMMRLEMGIWASRGSQRNVCTVWNTRSLSKTDLKQYALDGTLH